MELLIPTALAVLAIAGAVIGVGVALRSGGGDPQPRGSVGGEQGLLRMTAEVHTGWEQTLLGLVRELGLPRGAGELRYGQLYVETRSEQRLLVRSRSEIGRGFIGAIDLEPRRGFTRVTYSILRLPGDEALHKQVLDLELHLISALRRIDSDVNVQLAADALRDFNRRVPGLQRDAGQAAPG